MTVRSLLFVGLLIIPAAAAAQPQPAPARPQPQGQGPQTAPAPAPRGPQPREVERAVPAQAPPRPVQVESPGEVASRRAGQAVNVKVDVTFHDQVGNEQRRTKTVSVVTADGLTGFVRTIALYDGPGLGPIPLNIDVEPRILTGGKIRLLLNLQYTLPALNAGRPTPETAVLRSTEIRENLSLVLDDGKSMVVAQSADPVGDRRVTVEVVASVTK